MARFDSLISTAARLTARNGQSVTLRTFTNPGPTDPDKPWEPAAPVAADQTVNAVFYKYHQKYIDGDRIRQGDQQVLIAAKDVTTPPAQDSLIIRGSEVWKVVNGQPTAPNGQLIIFELQVRQ